MRQFLYLLLPAILCGLLIWFSSLKPKDFSQSSQESNSAQHLPAPTDSPKRGKKDLVLDTLLSNQTSESKLLDTVRGAEEY